MKGLTAPQQGAIAPIAHTVRGDILVVDDDPDMRDLLRARLDFAGYEVRTAEDAIVAGRMVLERSPDLLIVDVRLPYMTGLEFVAALRADDTLPAIAVIFVTAHEPSTDLLEKAAGAPVLQKPVPADRLFETVDRELELMRR